MGVADLFVKPHPWNFVKCFIFYICLNVITIVFWISKSFQIYKFLNPTSYPVLELSLAMSTSKPCVRRKSAPMYLNWLILRAIQRVPNDLILEPFATTSLMPGGRLRSEVLGGMILTSTPVSMRKRAPEAASLTWSRETVVELIFKGVDWEVERAFISIVLDPTGSFPGSSWRN